MKSEGRVAWQTAWSFGSDAGVQRRSAMDGLTAFPARPPAYSTMLGETAAPYRSCDGARTRSLGET
ncbi:MAG TPA: hypothetical protein VGZ02_11590 [Candidatus Baltobacteraceae bacterium]|jgi:hypothetical protein|nr:hypothetical protein [Candidatus Baltobacteraceae bacterium]